MTQSLLRFEQAVVDAELAAALHTHETANAHRH